MNTVRTIGDVSRRLTVVALVMAPCAALAAESVPVSTPHVKATLVSNRDVVMPGERFQVALVQEIARGWHTYWTNPGDSGEPTRIEWSLPEGAAVGDIQWPVPTAIPVNPLVNYGFEGTTYLLIDVTAPKDARPGQQLALKANATWLVCEKICIPEEGAFTLDLTVGPASIGDQKSEQRIADARAALPQAVSWKARLTSQGDQLALALPGLAQSVTNLYFFPVLDTLIDHASPQQMTDGADGPVLQLIRSTAFKVSEPTLAGVLTYREDSQPRAINLKVDVDPALVTAPGLAATAANPSTLSNIGTAAPAADVTFWAALLLAFAGGLILNLMPCVLPVLFIKTLGFAQAAQSGRRELREQGLLFLAGVLATFAVLASVVIGLGALGTTVGWGYQLQSPPVVILLAVVMVLIGFNLLGAFEIGTSIQGVGQNLALAGGRNGAFMTGVLAVVVATPCTAPFMGAAIGYAVTQPPITSLAIFLALALGFAFPMVALAFAPGWVRLLPKPGRWMAILKQAFAFPMFATAIWLIWVASVQAGTDGVLAALGAVLAAGFVVWLLRTTCGGTLTARTVGAAGSLLAVAAASLLVLSINTSPQTQSLRAGDPQSWTPERVAALQAQGRPVFVNFTAAWCITCLANERVALSRQDVKDAFAALDVVYLKGDWTNRDAAIARKLAEHGRAGVPLYLFYPASKGKPAEVLPQLLTAGAVIEAAARAAGRDVKMATTRP